MKTLTRIFATAVILFGPLTSFAQTESGKKSKTGSTQSTYQRKTTKHTSKTVNLADTIRKQNAPILEDNGTVNTTGIIDGSRSSTGRPGADTLVNYTVKKRKKTVITNGATLPDTTKPKKKD